MEELEYLTQAQETLRVAKAWYVTVIDEDGNLASLHHTGAISNIETEGFLSLNSKHAQYLHAVTIGIDEDE